MPMVRATGGQFTVSRGCRTNRRWGARSLGWRYAHRHLERELRPLPDRPGRGLRAASRHRRTRAPGDQGPRRPVADDGPARRSATRSRPTGTTSGTASRSSRRVGARGRRARLRRHAGVRRPGWPPRPGRSARPAAGSGCGRSTCPTAARSATRTWTTSWPGSHALRDAAAGWLAEDPDARSRSPATGTSRRATRTSSTSRSSRRAPTSRLPERAAFQAVVDAGYADVVRPHHPGPEVYTYWDYYRQRFERNRGMRIDFVLGSPALAAAGDRRARSTARSAAGTGASDHAPVIVDLAD